MGKPVIVENDMINIEVSLIRSKYENKEKFPFILITNKEIDVELRMYIEEFIQ